MSEFVTFNLAIQGESVVPVEVPVGTSLQEFKVLKNVAENLEFRIRGEVIDCDFTFDGDEQGFYLVGTKNAKGGVI